MTTDLTTTIKIPAETMRELVFGRVPRIRRQRLAAFVLGLAVAVLTPFAALAAPASTKYVDECSDGRCWLLDDADDSSVTEVSESVARQLDPTWFADRALDFPGRKFPHRYDVPRVTDRVSCDELVSEADVLCSIAFDYESAQEDREERALIRECLERLIPTNCGVEVTDLLP